MIAARPVRSRRTARRRLGAACLPAVVLAKAAGRWRIARVPTLIGG